MLGVRTLRIRSSVLASALAVASVAAAVAAGTGTPPEVVVKSDRLPIPVRVSCPATTCDETVATAYRTTVETDHGARTTTLMRTPIED